MAGRYFADGDAKAEVAELLRKRGLDETAIEAEAFRLRALELEILNRMKAFQFSRRDKSIFILAEIRQRGSQLTNNTVDESEPPRLVEVVKRGADHG